MNLQLQIMKDKLGQKHVIIFDHGKFDTPLVILYDFEFEKLITKYQKESKDFDNLTGDNK
ncbi:hypothetical protein LCGC14_0174310 [marine sediment metagenome]|uniref:Uncharacterized protein n=1 Tax=marine sediment metagenome TaxID=412755 RepID=A0A0F9XTF6_9ZZZZ